MLIQIVSACDCIALEYNRSLIQSGEKGDITATFMSQNQLLGTFSKDIDIIFDNTDKDGYPLISRVTLSGTIVE